MGLDPASEDTGKGAARQAAELDRRHAEGWTGSEDTRERVARAICESMTMRELDEFAEGTQNEYLRAADAVLAVVGSSPTDPGVPGECQVCGTETDEHHPNCEIGQLQMRARTAEEERDAWKLDCEEARAVGSSPVGEERSEPFTNDERHLRLVATASPREVYAYTTEAAKRLLDDEGKHLVIDANGAGLDFRLLDLKDDLGVSDD